MEELEALAVLVRKMRDAQKLFFKTRQHPVMYEAQALERAVDKKIKEILDQ